jgi:hypothetical protein
MIDPLDIVNKFTEFSYEKEGKPCPIAVMPDNRVWLTKLCALAERCATAENERDALRAALAKYADHNNWGNSQFLNAEDRDLFLEGHDGWEIAEQALRGGGE